jgi:hypothetical protein
VLLPDDYAARVQGIESATTVADMMAIVTSSAGGAPVGAVHPAMSSGSHGTVGPAAERTLDPVDLARMMAPSPNSRQRSERSRYGALIAMAVIFIVLLVGGLLLASHVHAGGGTIGGVDAGALGAGLVAGGTRPVARDRGASSPQTSSPSVRRSRR